MARWAVEPRALGAHVATGARRAYADAVTRTLPLVPLAVGALLASTALAQGAVEGTRPACARASAEVRSTGYAYNHVVIVENRCEVRVVCRVSTDVTPEPSLMSVEPGQRSETLTRRGSPASRFTATVDCTQDD